MTILSLVLPSHRDTLKARACLMRAASLASDDVQIVIRDNSGSQDKLDFLVQLIAPNVHIVPAEPCSMWENFRQAAELASGEFVLFRADDDDGFDTGLRSMVERASACDESVIGLTGTYVLEQSFGSSIVTYANIDAEDAGQRVEGFLSYQGPDMLLYSAIRRSVLTGAWELLSGHPFGFPFQDNLYVLIYLLSGRIVNVGRLATIYDNGNWDTQASAEASNREHYLSAGLDPRMSEIHWLMCAFEGAHIALCSRFGWRLPPSQRRAAADAWLSTMLRRGGHAPISGLDATLDYICAFIARFSPEKAEAYREFWLHEAVYPL